MSTLIICLVVFGWSVALRGERDLGALESIQGIPFPKLEDSTIILEEMAHVDLFLRENVFAKKVTLTISFDPEDSTTLDVGVRENEFWLSYIPYRLYEKGVDPEGVQTKEIEIPLTSALQDVNRSVDLMFFSSGKADTKWRIHAFRATVEPIMPTIKETKNYIKSIIVRERPL